jgi:hypothetical protein
VTATASWQSVTLFFSTDFRQAGFGTVTALDLAQVYGMQWQVNNSTGANIGIQLDNVQFVTDVPPPTPTPDCYPIEDLEDGDNMIKTICTRGGPWYIYSDMTDGNTLFGSSTCYLNNGTVEFAAAGQTFESSAGGAGGSAYCARITGMIGPSCGPPAYDTCPFVGMAFDFKNAGVGPKVVYDCSMFTGVSFDVKMENLGFAFGSNTNTFRVNVPVLGTTSTGEGGSCTAGCDDHLGSNQNVAVADSGLWVNRTIAFSTLDQAGWGSDVGAWAANNTGVYGLRWHFDNDHGAGSPYDISVDNIVFY